MNTNFPISNTNKYNGSSIEQYRPQNTKTKQNLLKSNVTSSSSMNQINSNETDSNEPEISTQILEIKNKLSGNRIFLVILILLYLGIVGYLIFYVNSNSNKFNKIQDEFQKAFDELNQMLNVLQMREAQITAAINNYMTTSSPS